MNVQDIIADYLGRYNMFGMTARSLLTTLIELYPRMIHSRYHHNMWINDAYKEGLLTYEEKILLYMD